MTLRNKSGAAGLDLVEEVIDQMVSRLKGQLPAKLSAMEGQYADGLELPAPRDENYYTPTNESPSPLNINYPAIFAVGGRVRNTPGDEGMRGNGGDMDLAYTVAILVLCKGETEQVLTKYLYRYSLAVVEVLVQSNSLTNGDCFLELIDYENPQLSTDDDSVRDVPIQFVVYTNESY